MKFRSFMAFLAFAGVLIGSAVAVVAQDATPASGTVSAGVTRQPLTSEAVSHLEGMAGPLTIERLRIPAGASVTMSQEDGELVVIVMERGTLEGSRPAQVTIQHEDQRGEATARGIAAVDPFSLSYGDVLVSLAPVGMELSVARARSRSRWRLRQHVSPQAHRRHRVTQRRSFGP